MKPRSVEPLTPPTQATSRRSRGAWWAAAVGALCFLNSLTNDLVYDDLPIIRENPRIRSLANIGQIWLSDWWKPLDPNQEIMFRRRDRLYRPLAMYTFALNYAVGGKSPLGYHAVNVLLHAAACVLVWRLAQRLHDDTAIANCAALLFAVHPIHCEAVANVVGRAEVLAALFLLLGSLVLLPRGSPPGWKRAAVAAVLFLAALFGKETAVCYIPVALLLLQAAAPKPERRVIRWWLMHAVILLLPLALYLPLRYVALERHLLRDLPPHVLLNPLVQADGLHRWLHALTVAGHYARLLIAPVNLSANYGLAVLHPDRGPELLTLLGGLVSAAAAVALAGYWRSSVPWRRLAVLTALSLASYALISNTVLLIGVSVAERLMYWPSVPMLMAVAVGVVYLWRYATGTGRLSADAVRWLPICGVLLLAALGLRSMVRNTDWVNNLTLFERDVQTYPQSAELNEAVANDLLWHIRDEAQLVPRNDPGIRAKLLLADRHLEAALRIYPQSPQAMQLRGRVLGMLGQRDRAIAYLETATTYGPLDQVSQQLLASLRDAAGEEASRLANLAEQVSTRPTDMALRLEYGELLLQRGRRREAQTELEEVRRLAPKNATALRLLGETYAGLNEGEKAIELLKNAAALDPNDWRVHVNLSALLAMTDPEGCLYHAQEAQRLQPTAVATNQQLAEALALNGRVKEALEIYRRIERGLAPDDPSRHAIENRVRELEQGRP